MSRFDSYFLMTESDVIEYVREKYAPLANCPALSCREIGNGNLNYVFLVRDDATGSSVIVKQAGPRGRLNPNLQLSPDRNRIEAEILLLQGRLAPGLVPEVYLYDTTMYCCLMEDLSGHTIMRDALLQRQRLPHFADHITTFMVNTLLFTADAVKDHQEKKALVKAFINPQMCEISERLVYTDPFTNLSGRNRVFEPIGEFVAREIYGDMALRLEAAKLKFAFMTDAEALIHGDLHTGSIFVTADSTKVIDPEFACYGPMGYDVGNVIAHLFLSWANANAAIVDGDERAGYRAWLEQTIIDVVEMFKAKFTAAFEANAADVMAQTPGFGQWYLAKVLADTAGVAGLECMRRTVGVAQVADLTTIAAADQRAGAEKSVLTAAKDFVMNRTAYKDGQDYVTTIKKATPGHEGAKP